MEVVHYADPLCWWSWGLEPVLQRLREVYGDQVKITYKMGGFAESISEWRKEYDVVDDASLRRWVGESISLTKNPIDIDYILKTKLESSWPACVAVKAAQLQDESLAESYFRRLMEAGQVEAKNVSKEDVYLEIAKKVGLNVSRMKKDISSGKAEKLFHEDRDSMDVNFLSLKYVEAKTGKEKVVGQVFAPHKHEQTVEELTGESLRKKTPVDILGYFERLEGHMVHPREVSVVFGTTVKDAEARLKTLTEGSFIETRKHDFGSFYSAKAVVKARELTDEQLKASHVSVAGDTSSAEDFTSVITEAVKDLYTDVALNPDKVFHFPLGREAAVFVGYPKSDLDRIPGTAVESFAGVGYPHAANVIKPGDTVLDIGSGSGTDVLIASLKTGPKGTIFGLDITDAMISKARANIEKMGARNVKILKGPATKIPLEDQSVDVVTTNGVLNLVLEKKKALQEIKRILKPGGQLQIADIVVQKDVQRACGLIPQLWADCIGERLWRTST